MEHIAIDLGARESQVCVRDSGGGIVEERRIATRPERIRAYLEGRRPARVIVEAGAEAFWVAEVARATGHDVRVVASTLAPALGVGERGHKSDRRDAQVLSQASCRVDLPSVYLPSGRSRELRRRLGIRQTTVRARTRLLNVVHGYLRNTGERVRGASRATLVSRVRAELGEKAGGLEPVFSVLETLDVSIATMTREVRAEARGDALTRRLQTVPGVGPITALRFRATLDEVERFGGADSVASYLGVVPSEHSSGDSRRRGGITKAGSPATRAVLVEAAWAALRCRSAQPDPMIQWARRLARRRGKHKAAVALARKLARVLYALWRDGTTYEAARAPKAHTPASRRTRPGSASRLREAGLPA